MKDDIELKNLWAQQSVAPPNVEELQSKIASVKRSKLTKLLLVNATMIGTSIYLGIIWYFLRPQMLTTTLGFVVVIIGMLAYLIAYNRLYADISSFDENQSNQEFIGSVIKLNENERFIRTRMLQIYFITLTLGSFLAMYEYILLVSPPWSFIILALTAIWYAINWFYFRPMIIRKEEEKVKNIIDKYEVISQQNNDL